MNDGAETVERAIILLKSYSKLAPNPAINIVRL
jgi:hypothetical protein